MLNKNSIVLLLIISAFSCSNQLNETEQEEVAVYDENWDLDWIIGESIDSNTFKGREVFIESWIKESENLYSGEKFSIKKGDTLSPTLMTITKTDGKFYYSYSVNKEQVTFIQDSISNNYVSFRNTTNVFPDQLIYSHYVDTIIITFLGIKNGIELGSSFKTIKTNSDINN